MRNNATQCCKSLKLIPAKSAIYAQSAKFSQLKVYEMAGYVKQYIFNGAVLFNAQQKTY